MDSVSPVLTEAEVAFEQVVALESSKLLPDHCRQGRVLRWLAGLGDPVPVFRQRARANSAGCRSGADPTAPRGADADRPPARIQRLLSGPGGLMIPFRPPHITATCLVKDLEPTLDHLELRLRSSRHGARTRWARASGPSSRSLTVFRLRARESGNGNAKIKRRPSWPASARLRLAKKRLDMSYSRSAADGTCRKQARKARAHFQ